MWLLSRTHRHSHPHAHAKTTDLELMSTIATCMMHMLLCSFAQTHTYACMHLHTHFSMHTIHNNTHNFVQLYAETDSMHSVRERGRPRERERKRVNTTGKTASIVYALGFRFQEPSFRFKGMVVLKHKWQWNRLTVSQCCNVYIHKGMFVVFLML